VDIAKDKELLKLMVDSNCSGGHSALFIGFESTNPATLKEYNKRQTVKDIRKCVKTLHDHGQSIFGMFVIGADNDTKKSISKTADFCCDTDMDAMQMTPYTPLPGTRVYEEFKAQKRIITSDWGYYDWEHVVHRPKLMTPYELQVAYYDAFRTVYSPKRTMHYLLSNNMLQMVRNAYFMYHTRTRERRGQEYLEFLEKIS
jgi:radical SAM superfamily enzyme YgiQ (UPF0313 family)